MPNEIPANDPRLASDQYDAVLGLALGSLAVARRFEGYVSCESRAQPLGADDPLVLAALGAISLSRSLTRWLEEAAELRERAHVDGSTVSSQEGQDLLR
jgi:hypothetical protein